MFVYKDGRFEIKADSTAEKISDVLRTPKGSVVMFPEYGSDLWKLVDQPLNDRFRMKVYREAAKAAKNLKDIQLKKIEVTSAGKGSFEVDAYFENEKGISKSGVKISA